MKNSKVKNILFKMEIKGVGVVNYDSTEQKWTINQTSLNHMKTRHDNTSYAKKRFYGTPEDTKYKLIISSDCLRHEIFKGDVPFHSPNVINHETLLTSLIASPASLIRGYMLVNKDITFKRKSPLVITSAEQTNDAMSYIETFSSSAQKNVDKDKEGSDASFYKKEVVGQMVYESNGFIDLMNLQFVSCDQIFDRSAFNPDLFNVYKQFLQSRIPSFNSELGYYQIKDSIVELSEYGFKITNDVVNILVRELFKRMISMNIQRKDAFAETTSLKYKLVYDVIEDTLSSEDGWITVENEKDIENISFEVEDFYVPSDVEKENEKREIIEGEYNRLKEKKREERESIQQKKVKKEMVKQAINFNNHE
jgi:hypothetical protein